MSNTIYLVASLPLLRFLDAPPSSLEDFRFHCQGVLTVDELQALDLIIGIAKNQPEWEEAEKSTCSFVRAYAAREMQLRNAMARLRATTWGSEARFTERAHTGYDVQVARAAIEASAKPDPLQKEQELDLCRWAMAEELALDSPFSLDAVLAFAVKLAILGRWASFNPETGSQRLRELIEHKDTESWNKTQA